VPVVWSNKAIGEKLHADDADVDAAVHAPDERLLEKTGEPRGDRGPILPVLQLRSRHQTLRVTPAMEAGIADRVWSIEEIVGLLA
jgi:hypothetical protein